MSSALPMLDYETCLDVVFDDDDAVIIEPVDAEDLARMNREMFSVGVAGIPSDYRNFLRETNGLIWDSITFYGTKRLRFEEEDFYVPDVLEASERAPTWIRGEGRLVIGRTDSAVFAHDIKAGYVVLDSTDGEVLEAYASFQDLFTAQVAAEVEAMEAVTMLKA